MRRFLPHLTALVCFLTASSGHAGGRRDDDAVAVTGEQLTAFAGCRIDHLALLACTPPEGCHPIPFQIDERDAQGRWVLEQGPQPSADDPPGRLDDNDLLFFMAADAGARASRAALPGAERIVALRVHDPLTGADRWAYLAAFAQIAPRSATSYVGYDPTTDRVRGTHVSLGFVDGMPGYLAVDDGPNLLDRLKVRASATFLFGLIHFARSEADLRTEFMGWHAGPIRIIRAQRQWIRLGWGIRSATFGSYTYFYRAAAELPVSLRLNFKPTHFFGDIVVRAILDFRDLRGWSLTVPGRPDPLPIDGTMSPAKAALAELSDAWFALRGPGLSLVQTMSLSPSLATVRRRMVYGEGAAGPEPPEAAVGGEPAIGWRFDRWEHVGPGAHQLAAMSYALPLDVDVRAFMRSRSAPLQVEVEEVP